MRTRRPIVGGNWKMNTDLASAVELAEDLVAALADAPQHADVVVFPPFPYLHGVGRALRHSGIALGAQDVYHQPDGAYTGEVSVDMLADLNVTHVIVGHSERRHVIGEDDHLINRKARAALAGERHVVLCVGETEAQRDAGETDRIIVDQLVAGLRGVEPGELRRVVIAYEPVWAIGTGRTASPDDAQKAHERLRETLADVYDDVAAQAMRIQYGGSVKPGNAADLFARPDVDGFLVGGASLKAADFAAIVRTTFAAPRQPTA